MSRNILFHPISLSLLLVLVLLGYLVGNARAQSASPDHLEQVPLYTDLGSHHYAISSQVPGVQAYFDQGLRLYYAFNHAEAIRSFRQAQRLDPQCAICWWGEALSWGPNINLPMDTASAQAAYAAISGAEQRAGFASPRERRLIEALSVRYSEAAPAARQHLDLAYAEAMAALDGEYPNDPEIAVLYAESLMDLRPWDYWTADQQPQPGIAEALARLERVIAADRNHPGACHFYIHAVEAVYPERAVACAERLATLMPGAGHLVHMPGHIYIRVGRYLDAVRVNEHAVHADETYIQDQSPAMGMYTAGYYPHNYDFMAFAAMMIGRGELAINSARQVIALLPPELVGSHGMDFLQQWSVRPLLMQVRFARWDAILHTPRPSDAMPHALGIWHYAQGRALAQHGDYAAADEHLRTLQSIAKRPAMTKLRMEFNSSADLLAIAAKVLAGHLHAAQQDFDSAIALLRDAVQREDALFYGEPPEWSVPVRQDLGAVLLVAGDAVAAEKIFREDLAKFPQNGWSLFGLSQALQRQGKKTEAAEVKEQWKKVWASADTEIRQVF